MKRNDPAGRQDGRPLWQQGCGGSRSCGAEDMPFLEDGPIVDIRASIRWAFLPSRHEVGSQEFSRLISDGLSGMARRSARCFDAYMRVANPAVRAPSTVAVIGTGPNGRAVKDYTIRRSSVGRNSRPACRRPPVFAAGLGDSTSGWPGRFDVVSVCRRFMTGPSVPAKTFDHG